MPQRRYGHPLVLQRVDPGARFLLLKLMYAPKHLRARAERATTPAAIDALLEPRRRIPKPPKGCARGGRR